ncbi:MAG: hypothetical protein U1A78_20470 [Polyangia bacterium]
MSLDSDPEVRYIVSGPDFPRATFGPVPSIPTRIRIVPGSLHKRNAGIALLCVSSPILAAGVSLLLMSIFGAAASELPSTGGTRTEPNITPYLISGVVGVAVGGSVFAAGMTLLGRGRTVVEF